MADKMTLIDVRDWHRKCATMYRRTNEPALANLHNNMADALDAHLAGMGEPVAWIVHSGDDWITADVVEVEESQEDGCRITPLYLAPPASGDWDKVRNLVMKWRHNAQECAWHEERAASTWRSCAHDLERALSMESQP